MVRKSSHPENELVGYLNGTLASDIAQTVEQHLEGCGDCSSFASVLRILRQERQTSSSASSRRSASSESLPHGTQLPDEPFLHPDVSELASFFYGKSTEHRRALVAGHVAMCSECAQAVSLYARAEQAAAAFEPASVKRAAFPQQAWEMIRDWEESSFARPRAPGEELDGRTLERLISLLHEQSEHIRAVVRNALTQSRGTVFALELVPVALVTHGGELLGVELFEKIPDSPGTELLEHSDRSERLNKKKLHAVIDYGVGNYTVVSQQIDRYGARLRYASSARVVRTDYFVFED
jgi:hypothetical protein